MTEPAWDSLAALEATIARLERIYANGRVTHPHLPWPKEPHDRTASATRTRDTSPER